LKIALSQLTVDIGLLFEQDFGPKGVLLRASRQKVLSSEPRGHGHAGVDFTTVLADLLKWEPVGVAVFAWRCSQEIKRKTESYPAAR
jgi:hypothetical protein